MNRNDKNKKPNEHPIPETREAIDAHEVRALEADPANEDAKLDIALDESFPTSDPPANTQPGKGKDPPPSSGYHPETERKRKRRS